MNIGHNLEKKGKKGVRGAVEKVPLILYNYTIIVNYFQGWKLC